MSVFVLGLFMSCHAVSTITQVSPRKWLKVFALSALAVSAGCFPSNGDGSVLLKDDFLLIRTSSEQVSVAKKATVIGVDAEIPARVLSVCVTGDFILATQRPPKGVNEPPTEVELAVNYWVLDVRTNTSKGPLSQDAFEEFRKQTLTGIAVQFTDASSIIKFGKYPLD